LCFPAEAYAVTLWLRFNQIQRALWENRKWR